MAGCARLLLLQPVLLLPKHLQSLRVCIQIVFGCLSAMVWGAAIEVLLRPWGRLLRSMRILASIPLAVTSYNPLILHSWLVLLERVNRLKSTGLVLMLSVSSKAFPSEIGCLKVHIFKLLSLGRIQVEPAPWNVLLFEWSHGVYVRTLIGLV